MGLLQYLNVFNNKQFNARSLYYLKKFNKKIFLKFFTFFSYEVLDKFIAFKWINFLKFLIKKKDQLKIKLSLEKKFFFQQIHRSFIRKYFRFRKKKRNLQKNFKCLPKQIYWFHEKKLTLSYKVQKKNLRMGKKIIKLFKNSIKNSSNKLLHLNRR